MSHRHELDEEHHPAERIEGGRIAGQDDGDRVQMTGDYGCVISTGDAYSRESALLTVAR